MAKIFNFSISCYDLRAVCCNLEKNKIEFRTTFNKIIFDGYYKVFKDDEEIKIEDFPNIKREISFN